MAGLLDSIDFNDPKTAGLLNLGLGILAGNTGRPGDMGQGLMGGLQNYQQQMAQQQRQKLIDQQQQMQATQFDWQKSDREKADTLAAERQRVLGDLSQQYGIDPNVVTAFPGIGEDIVKNKIIPKVPKIAFTPSGVAYDETNPNLELGKAYVKPESTPSGVQEYQFAKSQGYRGSFRDWTTEKARAGAASTNVSYGSPVAGVDASGNPVFFQPAKGGGAPSIVPGVRPKAETPKAPTESQSKAGTFHSQMVAASNELGKLSGEGYDPTNTATQLSTSLAGGITNPLADPRAQQARQAQEQWSESFLRVKTGAAATKDEVDRNVRTFFPQIGDSPQVIQQKARQREQAEQDVASMAGPARQEAKRTPAAQAQQMPAKPSAMTLKKGVVYQTPKGELRWNGKAFEDQ